MNFLSINDIRLAAYKKYQRTVLSIEPVAFEYNANSSNLAALVASQSAVTGYLPGNNNEGKGVAMAKIFTPQAGNPTILFDKCFYGTVNLSWLFDSTFGSAPCLASHIGAANLSWDITQLGVSAAKRNIEWTYQEVWQDAPVNAAINVTLENVMFDEIWMREQNPTLCAKGSGYLIHFV